MGTKTSEIGGGNAVGLGSNIVDILNRGLMTGVFGGPGGAGANAGVMGFLNDVMGQGAGNLGGSLGKMLGMQQTQDVNSLRARLGSSGGMGFGTPAAYAESTYRAHAAPEAATAIGGLQMGVLGPILQMMSQFGQKGISQRQAVVQPSDFSQVMSTLAPIAGAAVGGFGGLGLGGGMPTMPNTTGIYNPNASQFQMPTTDWSQYLAYPGSR